MKKLYASILSSTLLILLLPVYGICQNDFPTTTLPSPVVDSLIRADQQNQECRELLGNVRAQNKTLLSERENLEKSSNQKDQENTELRLQKDVLRETVGEKDILISRQRKKLSFVQWQRTTLLGSTVILLLVVLL